ncbi:General substrate transporter [Mycena venus]|uniref:General substrate transporter n=1 Tax=Mycena venus TaxID=2733690 RepID=A0A8H6YG96_9AGAR|nr:General substrate transporter [Mycena venus]
MSPSYPSATTPMRIPEVVAWNAENHPTAPCYLFAPPDPTAAVVTITHLEFSRATQRAAHQLRPNRQGRDGEVVALIALSDTLLYLAIVAGLITANCIPFPISPRNSPAAVVNLLRKTSCHRIVSTCVTLDALLEVPSVSQVYPNLGAESADCTFEPYLASANRPELDDVCLYLHSSGSTGFPKAIPETHRVLWQWSTLTAFRDMRDRMPHPLAGMPIPSFHMSGIQVLFLHALYGRIPVALYPPTATSPDALPIFPSPENVLEHSQRTGCRVIVILPALIIAWAQFPESVKYLATLDLVGFSGGSLPERLGKSLVEAGVNLRDVYGATEFGAVSCIVPLEGDERDWDWVRFADEVTVQWDPQGDGSFECQFLTSEKHTLSVENMKDVKGYSTSDLWINHPEKKHLWKMIGRIDDVIVHTSGEKTVPAPMEDIVLSSPFITGAVMFGWEREQTGILIEPTPSLRIDVHDSAKVLELRNKIWPIIEEANQIAPAFSRIFKEMIIFTSPDKPMPRTGKGTAMRKAALKVYAPEIDALYNIVGEKTSVDTTRMPTEWEPLSIQHWLLELAADLTDSPEIFPEVDLFHQGFDSLSATFLRLRILSAMRSSKDPAVQEATPDITQKFGLLASDHLAVLIESLVTKHTSSLIPPVPFAGDLQIVLLTGSTGNLGSQILASLLQDDRVVRVYALNRPSASGFTTEGSSFVQRHTAAFLNRGLDIKLLNSPKLHFVQGQTEKQNLGLSIRNSVTLIVHNAWKLDFNLSLASFENHILGTRHLVDLGLSSPRSPKFLFTSSIASAISWNSAQGPCPEEILNDVDINGATTGYGQSKFVAEQILARSGLRAFSLRIGQICGSVPTGAWATSDWVPILVKTSLFLGCFPLADGLVSWMDFESVTNAIMDVAFATTTKSTMYNLVHPRPVAWNFIIKALRNAILKRKCSAELRLVPFSDWFAELETTAGQAKAKDIPGIKLIDFFRYLAKASATSSTDSEFGGIDFSTKKMQAVSSTVQNTQPIGVEHVEAWLNYWVAAGFI